MSRKDYILFDLGGTLADPKGGITKSVQHALAHSGIQIDDLDSLTPPVRPLLRDNFRKCYNFSDGQAWGGAQAYREHFSVGDRAQNKEYPGTKEMLEASKEAGRVLLVVISKPKKFTRKILGHFDMTDYFDFIGGADMGEAQVREGDVIRYVLEQCGLESGDEIIGHYVVVGDREHDVLGARKCGMECVGVLHGYGDRQEMDGCGPVWIVRTVKELRDLLLPPQLELIIAIPIIQLTNRIMAVVIEITIRKAAAFVLAVK